MNNILITVITPTWNRGAYLQRVWNSLNSQIYKNFEWIVGDDGSTDDTELIIEELAKLSEFKITYIRATKHVGKVRMDNEAIKEASGELVLWCDSDDWLLPHALSAIFTAWSSKSNSEKNEFIGITALAATNMGVIVNPFANLQTTEISWNDLVGIHKLTADMVFCAKTDALKKHPFPEVDQVVPEGIVWTKIGNQLTKIIPEVLKMVEYRSSGAISFSGVMSYNRGRAHALAVITRNLSHYSVNIGARAWRLLTFLRYCIHGDIKLSEMRSLWCDNSIWFAFWLTIPFAYALAMRDNMLGKVNKTHKEFVEANKTTIINKKYL